MCLRDSQILSGYDLHHGTVINDSVDKRNSQPQYDHINNGTQDRICCIFSFLSHFLIPAFPVIFCYLTLFFRICHLSAESFPFTCLHGRIIIRSVSFSQGANRMPNPVLSIITVCFNSRDALLATMDNVLLQTWNRFEYLVIDGGSSDGTWSLLEQSSSRFDQAHIP